MKVAETEIELGKAGKSLAEVTEEEWESGGRVELVSQVSEWNENNSSGEFCTYRIFTDGGTIEGGNGGKKEGGKVFLKEGKRDEEKYCEMYE